MNNTQNEKVTSVLSLVFLLLFLITQKLSLLYISLILLIIYNFVPVLNKLVVLIWTQLTLLISTINSKIILSIIYILILTPIAILRRFKKNPLWLKQPELSSYWKDKNKTLSKQDLIKGW